MFYHFSLVTALGFGAVLVAARSSPGDVEVPRSVDVENVPPIHDWVKTALDHYRFPHVTQFAGWVPGRREILFRAPVQGGSFQVFRSSGPIVPGLRQERHESFPRLNSVVSKETGLPLFHFESSLVEPRSDDSREQLTLLDDSVAWAIPHAHREQFLFACHRGWDERSQLFLHDLKSEEDLPITNGRTHDRMPCWSNSGSSLALTSDARNGKDQDLYIVNPASPKTWRRLTTSPGWWLASSWSPDDRWIAVIEVRSIGSVPRIHLIEVATGRDEVVFDPPPGPSVTTDYVRWSRDGAALFWRSNLDSEFRRLARYDLATRKTTVLTASIPWDVKGFELSSDGRTIVLVVNEDGYSRLYLLDVATGRFQPSPRIARGQIANVKFRPGSREFGFEWSCTQAPPGIYSFDDSTGVQTEWIKPGRPLPVRGGGDEPELIRYPSFDGRRIPAFVRRPSAPLSQPPYPVLIEIHDGPFWQYLPRQSDFDDLLVHQMGMALIAPNVRGSRGYGRTYETLDDGERREDAVKDIGALLDWIATQPDLDKDRVAVTGDSYGGYMVLASLIHFGDRLKAGIDVAGLSRFETFLKNADPVYIDDWRHEFGDERDPKAARFLHSISPLTHADKIRRPLLVVHGRNDLRVKLGEAEQIVAAVRRNGVPAWSVFLKEEGHSIARLEHRRYVESVKVEFLSRFLRWPALGIRFERAEVSPSGGPRIQEITQNIKEK